MAQAIALGIGILGVAGVIFTALKYNRSDATEAINQQAQVVTSMSALNEEYRTANTDLKEQVRRCREGLDGP